MKRIDACLAWGTQALQRVDEPRLEVEVLLAFVLKKGRTYVHAFPEHGLSMKEQEHFKQLVQSRKDGVPMAYLTGMQEFWSLPLKVSEATLIPRADTETLVEAVLDRLPEGTQRIADLGTGSGAVALALAYTRAQWLVHATDVSLPALEIAQENAKTLGIENVVFSQGVWCDALEKQRYHAIVSNPPYIAPNDVHLQQGDLRFEPRSALVAEQEGLADIQTIADQARHVLCPQGLLAIEHGWLQAQPVAQLLDALGYVSIECVQDMGLCDRVTVAYWKGS